METLLAILGGQFSVIIVYHYVKVNHCLEVLCIPSGFLDSH